MTMQDSTGEKMRDTPDLAEAPVPGAIGDSRVTVLLDGKQTGGRFAMLALRERRGEEPPRHLHHWEDEALYVLEGELVVYLGDSSIAAPVGTAILLPRGVEHSYAITSSTASLLAFYAPSGFEDFYRALSDRAGDTSPALDRLISVAARYGCEITGPPPGGAGRSPPC